jgi:hypothetical protein
MTPEGKKQLMEDEGCRAFVYDDATGRPIKRGPAGGYPTIGYGRNLATHGLSAAEMELLLDNDLASVWASLVSHDAWIDKLNPVYQDVIIMVQYNTGDVYAFADMLAAFERNAPQNAAFELLNSHAAKQLPERYKRMADAIKNGYWVKPVAIAVAAAPVASTIS